MAKTEITLRVDEALLARARAADVDLVALLTAALEAAAPPGVAEQAAPFDGPEARARRWAEENAETIAGHNRFVEEHGAFGEAWRSW